MQCLLESSLALMVLQYQAELKGELQKSHQWRWLGGGFIAWKQNEAWKFKTVLSLEIPRYFFLERQAIVVSKIKRVPWVLNDFICVSEVEPGTPEPPDCSLHDTCHISVPPAAPRVDERHPQLLHPSPVNLAGDTRGSIQSCQSSRAPRSRIRIVNGCGGRDLDTTASLVKASRPLVSQAAKI